MVDTVRLRRHVGSLPHSATSREIHRQDQLPRTCSSLPLPSWSHAQSFEVREKETLGFLSRKVKSTSNIVYCYEVQLISMFLCIRSVLHVLFAHHDKYMANRQLRNWRNTTTTTSFQQQEVTNKGNEAKQQTIITNDITITEIS